MEFSNTPSFFHHGPSPVARLAISVTLSLALLVGDSQFGLMERSREGLSVALYPLQQAVNLPVSAARHVGDFFVRQAELKTENDELKNRQLALAAQIVRLQAAERDLNELKKTNQLRISRNDQGQIAEVLYTGRDPFSHKIIIDKGEDAGLSTGQPVLDEAGLIGQVTRVQPLSAEVTLVTDKHQMVPVMIQRTGVRAILYGYGGGVEVRYLPPAADIKPGDLLQTSGIDGLYPAGLPVAKVTAVERGSGASFARITSTPLGGIDHGRFVLALPVRTVPAAVQPASAPATATPPPG
ncbi:rod shape-determining protein MreC [Craterilacuibacter sinensis]|uniref:Cell shape-determining protein MreC n=1 Tax=Craterilacuibacter sinensis TaxID=2686017 RepID=A0A845BMF3_9NEIS|nr:rod shape-determining protein MreC [Craterilacuibacter sinensis]MXR36454.1 rod shape-determining protein MreC [Craterilacuibacter sinensis]